MKTAFVFALLALFSSVAEAQNQPPDFGLLSPKAAVVFDKGSSIAEALSLRIRDKGLERQIDAEFDQLAKTIRDSLSNPNDGFLIEVQLYTNASEIPEIPGGQLLLPIGIGREPVLALAELLSHKPIMTSPPNGLKDSSYYLWVQKDSQNALVARTVPPEFVPKLRREASGEARRMMLSRSDQLIQGEAPRVVDRATYWDQIASTGLQRVQSDAQRARIIDLTERFKRAEDEFNQSYADYVRISQKLAQEQVLFNALEGISALAGLIETGVEAKTLSSADKSPQLASTAPSNVDTLIRYSKTVIDSLGNSKRESITIVHQKGAEVERLDSNLSDAYKDAKDFTPQSGGSLNIPKP
jgi:hypothetical protein